MFGRPFSGAALRREGIHFVAGRLLLLARQADDLQQELTQLKQEISEIEDRLKYVAEHWERGTTPRRNGYTAMTP
jgi:hypothetical protein